MGAVSAQAVHRLSIRPPNATRVKARYTEKEWAYRELMGWVGDEPEGYQVWPVASGEKPLRGDISQRWAAHKQKVKSENDEQKARRRASARVACPLWADRQAMQDVYRRRDALVRATGIAHHVDHIVPLRHPRVSGLHVAANLRVITARENQAKGNRHWPDMPEGK